MLALLLMLALTAALFAITAPRASAARLDSRVTFGAESHFKPTSCVWGRLTAQGSAGKAQGIPRKKVLIQKKTKAGWRTVATAKTNKNGRYSKCIKAGYGKRKGKYRAAVRAYKISKGYKGSRDVSRSYYLW